MSSATVVKGPSVGSWALRGWWLGLAAGLVELVLAMIPAILPQEYWPGLLHSSPHRLWLKPLAGAFAGATIAFIAAVLQRRLRFLTARVIFWLVAASSLVSILMPYHTALGTISVALLAAGGAAPVSRFLMRRPNQRTIRWTERVGAAAMLVLAVSGGAIAYAPWMHERSVVSKLGPPASGAPNIVLVVLDTVRAPSLGADAGLDGLPNLSRLAASGVAFTQAVATSSWTLESHATLFTGLYPPQVFTDGRTPINYETPMPGGPPTIAEVLGRQGYLTGGFVANTNYTDREHGLNRGFAHYDDHPFTWSDVIASSGLGFNFTERIRRYGGRPIPVGMRNAWEITSSFLQWFDRKNGRPVFAFLNLFDAHDPYVPDPQFKTGPQVKDPRLNPYYSYPSGEIGPLKHAYDDCVRYLDHVVGRLADELQRRGQLDNTVLVVTSDHGEHFGEHGLVSHGNSLYRHLLQVPLLMRYPAAIPAGARVDQPISLRDVPATLLSMAGVPGATLPGTPLSWLWDPDQESRTASPILSSLIIGKTPHHFAPATWPVSRGAMRSVVAEGLHFIVNGDGREELYDWTTDLEETRNLSASAEQAEARRRLRAVLKLIEAGR